MEAKMKLEATKFFEKVCSNHIDVIKEMRVSIYNLCGISSKDGKVNEFIQEAIETFHFNMVEKKFFEQISAIVDEQLKQIENKIALNESVDYLTITNNLISSLNHLNGIDFRIEDDLKQLATQVVNRFPMSGVSQEDLMQHLIRQQEKMSNLIQEYNTKTIQTLTNLTPYFIEQVKDMHEHTNVEKQPNNETIKAESIQPQKSIVSNDSLSVDGFIVKCTEKLNEIDYMFKNSLGFTYSKSEIAKVLRQLHSFTENLSNKAFAQEILNRYMKLNEIAQDMIYDEIIFQNVPMLKEISEKYQQFLITDNMRKNNDFKTPDTPPPSINTYVGASTEEIRTLISQKKYFPMLQAIGKEDIVTYSNFINIGYQMMINDFYERVRSCKTYDEQHDAYFELYDIYQNFRDYISVESSIQLKEQLESMLNFLQQKQTSVDIVGVRYNTSTREVNESKSSMRM